jgi:dihydroorotate dehydrogenase (fumarate)
MDTATSYLGLRLPHPFIAGASPYGYHLDTIKRLEDAGCAAIVLHSLFEEQITATHDARIHQMSIYEDRFKDAVREFPPAESYPLGPDAYAEHIVAAKRTVAIPVIASLNGTSRAAWLRFARVVQQAGADAVELNPYEVVTDLNVSAMAMEQYLKDLVSELKRIVTIPVAVKLSPFFTAFGNLARQLDEAGADALVIFNRFYQADIDITTMEAHAQLELSSSAELLLRLRWLAILHGRVRCGLAATGGVATPNDGIKAILAGADAVQLVSSLLRHGPGHVSTMREGLEKWMEWNKMERLDEMRGRASLERTNDPGAFERANYIRALQSWIRP